MTDLAREVRARLVDARAVCTALGMTIARGATPRQAHVACPWHADRTPSCSVRLAPDGTIAVRCHGCGASGDALSLVAVVRGLDIAHDFAAVLAAAAEIAGTPSIVDRAVRELRPTDDREPQSDATYHAIWSAVLDALSPMRVVSPHVAAYLDARGVYADAEARDVRGLPLDGAELVASLRATFERAELVEAGVLRGDRDVLTSTAHPLLIPWRDRHGRIACVQRRRLDDGSPRYLSPRARSPRAPYGVDLLVEALAWLGPDAEIAIVEGAIDCLARRRIARHRGERVAVVGVYSASTPTVGLPLDLLAGRRVRLALDSDAAGERACGVLAEVLGGVARELVRERPGGGAGDWAAAIARAVAS